MFVIFIALLLSIPMVASPLITLSGAAISGASAYKQQGADQSFRGQFESGADIIVGLEFDSNVSAAIDLGFGAVDNVSNFVQKADLFGLTITVAPDDFFNTSVTLGFMTIPFGQFVDEHSANAIILSHFVFNDLTAAFLAQNYSLVNFGSAGVMTATDLKDIGSINLMVFNGTNFSAGNPDKGFGAVIRYVNSSLIENVSIGLSAMNSNDRNNVEAFNANTTGYVADIKADVSGVELGGSVTMLTLDDYNAQTDDDVVIYMVYAAKTFDTFTLATRYSMSRPKDYDGNGTGVSSAIPAIGLGNVPSADIDTARIQLAAVYHLDDQVNFHNEVVLDMYGENRTDYNNTGVLSYVSVNF